MATYLILNIGVMAVVLLLIAFRPLNLQWYIIVRVALILLILTAVFDSLIIHVNIVNYDITKILGIYIGKAPIEDFAYAVLVAILVPYIWHKTGKKQK